MRLPTNQGGTLELPLTEEEVVTIMGHNGLPWERDAKGLIVAVEAPKNRELRRREKFAQQLHRERRYFG